MNRIDNIKLILKNNDLNPLFDLESNETECFLNTTNDRDIRKVINKKILNFGKIINQIGSKLVYIKSGTTGHTFKGFNPNNLNDPNFAVKIVAYPKKENYGNLNDIQRPENAEIMMIRLLSYFIINNQTPHIVLPIGTFNTNIKPFLNLEKNGIVENKKYTNFIKRYENNEFYDYVSILISEWADGEDLLEYLKKNYKKLSLIEWSTIFFQIISTLATIQEKYSGFRHNDLKCNNILVQNIECKDKNNKFKYKINGQTYIIPNIDIQIKLWDFDFSCIENLVENKKVNAEWTDRININSKSNRYYDLHYFFNTLIRKGFLPNLLDDAPNEIKEFIYRIIPKKYRTGKFVAERGRLLANDEFIIPDHVIKFDPLFENFRR